MIFNMSRTAALIVTILAAGVNLVFAEGINCQGSSFCSEPQPNTMSDLANVINSQASGWYNNEQEIACLGAFCVFLQNSGGAPASSIGPLMNDLVNHGCKICGSVPLFYPQDNNVADGMVTVNYVSDPCPNSAKSPNNAVMC